MYFPVASINTLPGDSSVPASIDPNITASAPAEKALIMSPDVLIPPSAIMATFEYLDLFLISTISRIEERVGIP